MQLKNKESKQIKTNQSFVHIKHSISIRQYKYWHLLIKFFSEQVADGVQPDSDGFYYESRAKISEFIGYELMSKELKKDVEALRKEPIVINYLEKDGSPAIHGMGFISEYKITNTKIGFRLPSFIEKVVKGENESRKLFLLLNWNIFNSFTGKYEAIIYKLCKDYVGIGRTPYFSVQEYRDYIGLSETEYSENKSLFRRCIHDPLKKIKESELCDITVSVEFKKTGTNIIGLNFIVENKKQTVLPFEEFTPSLAFQYSKIAISQQDQSKYLTQFEEEEIAASIERANSYIEGLKNSGKNISMGAIYAKAISENWGKQLLEEREVLKQEQEKEEQRKQRKIAKENKKAADQKSKLDQEAEKTIALFDDFENYPNELKIMLIEGMLKNNKQPKIVYDPLKKSFDEYGVDAHKHSPMFKGLLSKEIISYKTKKELEDLLKDFESLNFEFKLAETQVILKLKPSLQAVFNQFGVDAHKHDEAFKMALIEHLTLKNIVSQF